MEFHQYIPQGVVTGNVEVMMYYSGFIPNHSIERLVPTGHAFIIFELDGFTRHTYDNETLRSNATFTKVWISGMHRNYISISAHENSSMFVIQFKPQGAYPYLHIQMDKIAEKIVPAEEILGKKILQLRDKLITATTHEEKFKLAEAWLNDQYDNERKAPDELVEVITELQREPAANLEQVKQSFPNSQKHLIDLFKKHVGITPKYYQRIMRFNDILQRIQNKEQIKWTDVAYSCGYTDQSHFIKEFRHFSGFNPQEFITDKHNTQSNFFPLDKQG